MGRPLSFGENLDKQGAHPCPEVAAALGNLRIGDIVRFSIIQDTRTDQDMGELPLRRQASTYGFTHLPFERNEYYIVASRYVREILLPDNTIRTLNMLVILPMYLGPNMEDAVLTWLVDAAGWVRIAEDFSQDHAITGVKVIGQLPQDHGLRSPLQDIAIDKDGNPVDGHSSVFKSNDHYLININKVYIPFA